MRALLTVTGAVLLLIATVAVPFRFVPVGSAAAAVLCALWPILVAAAVPATVLFLAARRWWWAAAAGVLVAVLVASYAPLYIPDGRDGDDGVPVRVLTANLRRGGADAGAFAAVARDRADVVAVEELTRPMRDALVAAGMDAQFPEAATHPGPLSVGVGLWARGRMAESRLLTNFTMPALTSQVTVPGVRLPVLLFVVHTANPVTRSVREWRDDLEKIRAELSRLADVADGRCVIVAGDFNATVDMRNFRQLLADGYEDAARQAGSGVAWTFPAHLPMPPFSGIDHVLTRGCRASSVEVVDVPGSDHRALAVTVRVPRA
ncbi:endonuclease/exonuclease/phosphatase family protein [Mycobacterium sp. ACS4331]|uniref:endonuclease/exonuclease/phosphatase family protein n=1 Tax=Mycobacterium sp. ACS4331 TaxID=1834121 RepID=UPI0007FD2316|nr:endonuclease/exonuclease/phosphatase family protein [Mycobacterium sp. ACS4331]OBF27932.1 hypothetical protein A5727_02290 [Mycobacterium sp. ACS4331]